MIDILGKHFKKRKIEYVRVTGDENDKQRKAAKARFQDPKSKVRVCCITMAGAEAINLQAGKAVIFYDTPFSGGDFLQILGRIHRIGSEHDKIYAIHLVMRDSVDGRVMQALRRKIKIINATLGKRYLDSNDTPVQVSTQNDISQIFQALQQDALRRRNS